MSDFIANEKNVREILNSGTEEIKEWKWLEPIGYVPADYEIFNDIPEPDEIDLAINNLAIKNEQENG
jgi:hypothetical protein